MDDTGTLKEKASDSTPTLPTNMLAVKINFPISLIFEVIPVDTPTVANAEISSNNKLINGILGSERVNKKVAIKINVAEKIKTEKAL